MQFEEARKKLKRLAKGKYYHLTFGFKSFQNTDKTTGTDCDIYIDGEKWFSAPTFKEVFQKRHDFLTEPKTEELPQNIPDGVGGKI